jgi:hypothetical protein
MRPCDLRQHSLPHKAEKTAVKVSPGSGISQLCHHDLRNIKQLRACICYNQLSHHDLRNIKQLRAYICYNTIYDFLFGSTFFSSGDFMIKCNLDKSVPVGAESYD